MQQFEAAALCDSLSREPWQQVRKSSRPIRNMTMTRMPIKPHFEGRKFQEARAGSRQPQILPSQGKEHENHSNWGSLDKDYHKDPFLPPCYVPRPELVAKSRGLCMSIHDIKMGFPYLGRGIALRNSYISTAATSIHGQVSESRSPFWQRCWWFWKFCIVCIYQRCPYCNLSICHPKLRNEIGEPTKNSMFQEPSTRKLKA